MATALRSLCAGAACSGRAHAAGLIPLRSRSAVLLKQSRSTSTPRALADSKQQAYRAAGERLRELLDGVSWESEDDLVRYEIASLTAEMRLMLALNIGSVLALTAVACAWLTGEDPLGGLFITHSLHSCAAGAGFALPLVVCSAASRLPAVRGAFPVLGDLHDTQRELVRPIVSDLNASQLLILAAALVVPGMLVLCPAVHGMAHAMGTLLWGDVLQPMGMHLHAPEALRRVGGTLVPAVAGAYAAAGAVTRLVDVTQQQYAAVCEALVHADRYFLMAAAEKAADKPDLLRRRGGSSSSSGSGGNGAPEARGREGLAATSFASLGSSVAAVAAEDGDDRAASGALRQLSAEMAEAFRNVSVVWFLTRRNAAQLGHVLTSLNVIYYSLMWHTTHDLATPITAALLAVLTELAAVRYLPPEQAEGGAAAPGAGSGST